MPGETPLDVQIRNTTKNMAYCLTHLVAARQEIKELREEVRKLCRAFIAQSYEPHKAEPDVKKQIMDHNEK
jgi:hypothetical protein